jgi:hypothetical protein
MERRRAMTDLEICCAADAEAQDDCCGGIPCC